MKSQTLFTGKTKEKKNVFSCEVFIEIKYVLR